jgi:hypothetical protein
MNVHRIPDRAQTAQRSGPDCSLAGWSAVCTLVLHSLEPLRVVRLCGEHASRLQLLDLLFA